MLEIPRRRFLAGLIGLIAAPAIVRVTSLMPVRAAPLVIETPKLILPDVGVSMSWGSGIDNVVSMNYDRNGLWLHPDAGGTDLSPRPWWNGETRRSPHQA